MNKYESIVIINPNVDEAGLKALEDKFTGLINENGKVEEVVEMGKRKYFPKSYTTEQIEEAIIKICESRYRARQGRDAR